MTLNNIPPDTKHIIDAAAAGVAGLTFLEYLPSIAAGLSIIWLTLQIFDFVHKKITKRDGK